MGILWSQRSKSKYLKLKTQHTVIEGFTKISKK